MPLLVTRCHGVLVLARRWTNHEVCDAWRVQRQTYGYFKPKFHHVNFPVTSPVAQIPEKFRGSRSNGILELKGTSQVCCGRHGEVGMVEFGLYQPQNISAPLLVGTIYYLVTDVNNLPGVIT